MGSIEIYYQHRVGSLDRYPCLSNLASITWRTSSSVVIALVCIISSIVNTMNILCLYCWLVSSTQECAARDCTVVSRMWAKLNLSSPVDYRLYIVHEAINMNSTTGSSKSLLPLQSGVGVNRTPTGANAYRHAREIGCKSLHDLKKHQWCAC